MSELTPEQNEMLFQIQQEYAIAVEQARVTYDEALRRADFDLMKPMPRKRSLWRRIWDRLLCPVHWFD